MRPDPWKQKRTRQYLARQRTKGKAGPGPTRAEVKLDSQPLIRDGEIVTVAVDTSSPSEIEDDFDVGSIDDVTNFDEGSLPETMNSMQLLDGSFSENKWIKSWTSTDHFVAKLRHPSSASSIRPTAGILSKIKSSTPKASSVKCESPEKELSVASSRVDSQVDSLLNDL